ncbi:MAG TPA: hypothetical protein VNW72_04000 [Chthoniobacterales bacterium]|jgi:hypothetical protein|nr:hypothetical protein [Chthoniobacterales bacterium]
MSDELSTLNFEADLKKVLGVPDANRWKVDRAGDLELFVTLSSAKAPAEFFQARLLWIRYPGEEPPSLKFREPETGALNNPKAWPVVRGFRPATLDACVNWTSEGMAVHPEWRNDPKARWDPSGNSILRIVRILQNEMDAHFTQRFQG